MAKGFQRRRLKCEKLTDDRRRTPSDGKSSHCLWQRELKNENPVVSSHCTFTRMFLPSSNFWKSCRNLYTCSSNFALLSSSSLSCLIFSFSCLASFNEVMNVSMIPKNSSGLDSFGLSPKHFTTSLNWKQKLKIILKSSYVGKKEKKKPYSKVYTCDECNYWLSW